MRKSNCYHRIFTNYQLYFSSLILLFLISCNSKKEHSEQEKIIPVTIMKTVSAEFDETQRHYIGVVEESSSSSISFQSMGIVQQVYVSKGQRVREGQLLAGLDKSTMQNNYNAAVATLNQAQDAFDRMSLLYNNNSLPEIKYIEAKTSLEQAKSNEYSAKKSLTDCDLYAPFSGVVGSRDVEPGMSISPIQSAFTLIKIEDVNIKVSIPEKEIGQIKIGRNADVLVTAINNSKYTGKVSEKSVTANPLSHTYEIKINLTNPEFKLLPGMVCKVYLKDEESEVKRINIPNRSILMTPEGKHFVWIEENGTAHQRFVTIGELTAKGINIISGLSENENIIIDGYQKVSEGMKVKSVNRKL
ncbi:efflux RND transporter periplasmic adaptor subunit [Parabacteroides sp. Marseille-P3160]|uniref:efflux RND transporter periplasmic adaptor subunit n=1 Tax=Parabacteroides sp. Marseille-P3160 TaxID=1917887 RepID=UPI0009BA424E|nr:efflux RND transporter periplasmic adaptor subunit [Parabacteroides sp. Marseille-P3160]